jgi:hypothetical protein
MCFTSRCNSSGEREHPFPLLETSLEPHEPLRFVVGIPLPLFIFADGRLGETVSRHAVRRVRLVIGLDHVLNVPLHPVQVLEQLLIACQRFLVNHTHALYAIVQGLIDMIENFL